MSNCCANSASVLSPRTAAKATFALKAGVWFRRGRLVIVSPVRHASWPLSGRNSTYPAVQISTASSTKDGRWRQPAIFGSFHIGDSRTDEVLLASGREQVVFADLVVQGGLGNLQFL